MRLRKVSICIALLSLLSASNPLGFSYAAVPFSNLGGYDGTSTLGLGILRPNHLDNATMKEYFHPTESFRIDYYSSWGVKTTQDGVSFTIMQSPVVMIGAWRNYLLLSVEHALGALRGFCKGSDYPCSIEERTIMMGNIEAYEFVIQTYVMMKEIVIPRTANEIYTANFVAYEAYGSSSSLYLEYLKQADESLYSFRLTGPYSVKATLGTEGLPSGTNCSVTVDRTTYAGQQLPKTMWFEYNSTHTISAEEAMIYSRENDTRYVFVGWSDGISEMRRAITVERGGVSYVASYKTQYWLTVRSTYGDPSGEGWYDSGTTATISAASSVPIAGIIGALGGKHVFSNWENSTGHFLSASSTADIIVREPQKATAIWKEDYSVPYLVLAAITATASMGILFVVLVGRRKATSRADQEWMA